MMQIYFKTMRDEEFQLIPQIREGCWIHVDEATPEETAQVAQLIGLEAADLHDCLDKYEIPRIERIGNNTIIYTRHPIEHEIGLYTSTLSIILTPHYVVTISPYKSSLVRNFVVQKNKLSTIQKSKLLIALFLKITQEFTSHIRRMRHSVLRQEKTMIVVESEDIVTLTKDEEVLNQFHASLTPLRNVLESIMSGRYTNLYEKDQDLLTDLLNAVKQSEDLCSLSVRSIRAMRDAYQIIFTNNVSKTIKLLTALTILFSIPTIVASFYGMNTTLPFASHPHAFYFIFGFTALVVVVTGIWFQRKRWL